MIKQSVKKPLTVLVAVIIVITLGFISYTKMTPDLMPNIDMPYVLVTTTYPGASPEKVESEVTKPLEKSLATLENIKNVTSSSNENYSTVVLEFNDDVNMDSITVDILQKIDNVKGKFDDMVGTPNIMKLNPSMMPIAVTAVDADDMNSVELSNLLNDEIMDKLESTEGVVSITTNGLINQTIDIQLSDDKIKALNKKITGDLNSEFDDKESELNKSESEIENGKNKIAEGKKELEKAQKEFAAKTASAQSEIDKKENELLEGKIQIKQQLQSLEEQALELKTKKQSLEKTKATINEVLENKKTLENSIALLSDAYKNYPSAQSTLENFELQIKAIKEDSSLSQEQKEAALKEIYNKDEYKNAVASVAKYNGVFNAFNIKPEQASATITSLSSSLVEVENAEKSIETSLNAQGITVADIDSSITKLDEGIKQIDEGKEKINTSLTKLVKGEIKLSEAMQTLQEQKTNAVLQFSSTSSNLSVSSVSLDSAEAQIKAGRTSFDEAKETAFKNADLTKLITKDMISSILIAENFSMPAGYVQSGDKEYSVTVGDEYNNLDDIKNQVLFDMNLDGIEPVRISDVADVVFADNSDDIYAKVNENNGVVLVFQKQSTYSTAEVSSNLEDKIKEIEADYDDVHFLTLMDQGDYIYTITDSLFESLIFGALFSVLILFIFLKDIRPTIVTLCSIPLSIMFALVLMYFTGVSINMMSLSGLAVSVGMLVDNSVVVIENIYRLKSKGISAVKAAVSGAKQVCGAIAASTLTTICVFFPIVFVEGITRQLFVDMALTIAYSLLASLIVAITLVPTMSARLLKNSQQKPNKTFDKIRGIYKKLLNKSLSHKFAVLALAVVLLVASCGLAYMKGFIFMPETDSNQLSVSLKMPKEAKFDDTKKTSDKMIEKVLSIDSVEKIGAIASDEKNVTAYVLLKDDAKLSGSETSDKINELCKNLDGEVTASSSSVLSSQQSALTGNGVSIKIFGNDIDELRETSKEMEKIISKVEGIKKVDNGIGETNPTIKISINKNKAMKKGLTVAQAYQEISNVLKTEVKSTSVSLNDDIYTLNITEGESEKKDLDYVENYVMTITNKQNEEVKIKLKDVADITESDSLAAIKRENQTRLITLNAEVEDDYNITRVTESVEKALKDYEPSKGVSYEFDGENETIMNSIKDLMTMLLIGVLLVYLIMVAQFQSLKSPFIVMFTIPLALTGGLGALLICNKEISVVSMMGFILLCGIIVNNGIVLVDYINKLRIEGMAKKDAIVEACITRIRPIFMTSITTILGLLIMALGTGTGSDIMQPVAIVCIGGLLYATLLTLFVVPIIYDLMNRKDIKVISDEELKEVDE